MRERYNSLGKEAQHNLKIHVTSASGISIQTFYRYLDSPENMKARAFEAFCTYFDVLGDELLPVTETQTA